MGVHGMFGKCGHIESVRIVRDSATGIGRGIGYVNFSSSESVSLALRLSNQELAGRRVRVTQAVRKAKPGKLIGSQAQKKEKALKDGKKSKGFKPRKVQKSDARLKKAKPFQGESTDIAK